MIRIFIEYEQRVQTGMLFVGGIEFIIPKWLTTCIDTATKGVAYTINCKAHLDSDRFCAHPANAAFGVFFFLLQLFLLLSLLLLLLSLLLLLLSLLLLLLSLLLLLLSLLSLLLSLLYLLLQLLCLLLHLLELLIQHNYTRFLLILILLFLFLFLFSFNGLLKQIFLH